MIVCIDTNSLVQLFGKNSPFRTIAVAVMDGRMDLAVSTAILLEYEEVATAMYGPVFAREVIGFLDLATASGSVKHLTPHFHFRIITADPDDDIFADCAIRSEPSLPRKLPQFLSGGSRRPSEMRSAPFASGSRSMDNAIRAMQILEDRRPG